MKITKKLLAVILSVLMIVSMVFVPVAAEEIAELITKEVSIFDLSDAIVGEKVSGSDSALPTGLDKTGIRRYNTGVGKTTYHDGSQEIVEVDGKKALKVNFDVEGKQQGWLYGTTKVYSILIKIPSEYAPYITGFEADITNGAVGALAYRFGIRNATLSKYGIEHKGGFQSAATGDSTITKSTSNLKTLSSFYAATHDGASEGIWSDFDYAGEDLFLLISDQSATDGGTGYAIIKDIRLSLSATANEWENEIHVTEKVSIWDLSANALGAATSVVYPDGFAQNAYAGALEIVESANTGKKALRFDLSNTAFSNDNNANGGRFNEHHYSPLYTLRMPLPEGYGAFVEEIELTVNKQTESKIPFNFGVKNSVNWSKTKADGWNLSINADSMGIQKITYNPTALYKTDEWRTGAWSKSTEKWGGDFTELFLKLTADNGATGYIDIEDITYTIRYTSAQKAVADAKINFKTDKKDLLINDFEASGGTESEFATSGTMVKRYKTGSGGYGGTNISINNNPALANAGGISFWIYNPDETANGWNISLHLADGTKFFYERRYSLVAGKHVKIVLDFDKLYEWVQGKDEANSQKGGIVSLTPEQIADISYIRVWSQGKSKTILIDDIYLWYSNYKDDVTLDLTADTVEGATVVDNKIKFESSAEGSSIAAKIELPEKVLVDAQSIVLNYDTDVAGKFAVSMLGTNDSGSSAHWKWGYKNHSGLTPAAGVVGGTYTYNLAGHNLTYNHANIHEAGGLGYSLGEDCNSCNPPASWGGSSGHANNPPSENEKAGMTTLVVYVFDNIGEDTQAITLNSVTIKYTNTKYTNTVSAENGVITLLNNDCYAGDEVAFTVDANQCYEVETVTATDANGKTVMVYDETVEAENFANYYVFKQPAATVTVSATFKDIHAYDEGVETAAPDCVNAGSKVYTCATCGGTKTEEIAALGHTEVVDKAVDADCENAGLTEGKHCSVCNEVIVPQTNIDALGHNYKSSTTEPDCGHDGATVYTCTVCGDTYTDTLPATGNHAYDDGVETVAPTCTDKGELTITCGVCGDSYTEEIAELGHTDSEPVDNGDGTHTINCSVCGELISTVEHEFVDGTCGCGAIEGIVEIDGVKYATLEAAIAAANAGDEIVLIDNVVLEAKLNVNKDVTINLNGYKITTYAVNNNYDVIIGADVTITGNGTVNVSGVYGIGVQAAGNLVVENGTFKATTDVTDYIIGNWGTVTINGGTFDAWYCAVNGFDGNVAVNDGTFKASAPAEGEWPYIGVAGNVEITGGTYDVDVTYYCAEGLKAELNDEGVYGIVITPINYTFGNSVQLTTTEPWKMLFNATVYNNDIVVDIDTLSGYGMYVIAANALTGEATVENIVANAEQFSNDDACVIAENGKITVEYYQELYTYEMNKDFYVLAYAIDKNGFVSYGEVKTRSFAKALAMYTEDNGYTEAVIDFARKAEVMYEATTQYRSTRPETYIRNTAKPETVADYNFGTATAGDYKFGHTMQLTSIEPWALIFNAAVRAGGNVIDYSACDEYGVIISDTAYTSIEDVDANAYVYNNVNGGATIKEGYISVDYVEGITTSEMGKNFYAMFYVVIDGQYYYGAVKTRSMMSVANQYFANADIYEEDLIALLNAMNDLYEATVAYKSAANGL